MSTKDVVSAATVVGGGGAGYGAYKCFGDFNSVAKKLYDEKFELLDFDISENDGINYKIWKFLTLTYGKYDNSEEKIPGLSISIVKPDDNNLDSAIKGLIGKCREIYETSYHSSKFSDLKSKAEKWCTGNIGTRRIKNKELPIIFLTNSSDYWNQAYYRYYLEVDERDSLSTAGSKDERKSGKIDDSKRKNLEKECEKFLLTKYSEGDEYHTGRWCFQYKAVKDSSSTSKLKDLSRKSEWSGKYDLNTSGSSSGNHDLKDVLNALFKNTQETQSSKSQEEQKAYAMHSWCSMALNGSSTKAAQIMSACLFENGR